MTGGRAPVALTMAVSLPEAATLPVPDIDGNKQLQRYLHRPSSLARRRGALQPAPKDKVQLAYNARLTV